ncbi:MAG: DUF2061 domain-containing protein [Hadesarchaea archaeon]|nr:DUF2061 domain-containing protein [Hadesarchaea archaeon]
MFLVTFIVAYALTGEIASSIGVSIGANSIKTVTYFLHERLWSRVNWGRK